MAVDAQEESCRGCTRPHKVQEEISSIARERQEGRTPTEGEVVSEGALIQGYTEHRS